MVKNDERWNLCLDVCAGPNIVYEDCMDSCLQGGGNSKAKFAKTNKSYTGRDGVERIVYSKNGKNYVKKRDAKTGKFVMKPIKA